ncbi:AMP-binding protein [Clostridium paraputrificum]|uniref:AMP-binding protein n=1 Tax=Clostridium paraputrificum TaxID=29363 RepID=UPI003D34B7E6
MVIINKGDELNIEDYFEYNKRIIKNKKYAEEGKLEKITFFEKLEELEDKYKGKIAVRDSKRVISYTELRDNALKYANYFESKGIIYGNKIIMQISNSVLFAEVCFALWAIGAIPIFTIPALRFAELKGIAEVAEPVAYFSDDEYLGNDNYELGKKLKDNFGSIKHLFFSSELEAKKEKLEMVNKNHINNAKYYDIATLLLSSGTTGVPKLIPRSHADYLYNSRCVAEKVGLDSSSRFLLVLPVQHTFGFAAPGFLGTLQKGGTVIMCNIPSPDEVLPLIESENINVTAMVPSFAKILVEFLQYDDYDISSLEKILIGGAYLSPDLGRQVKNDFGIKLFQVYGFSEGLITTTDINDSIEVSSNSVGKPASPYDIVKIVDNENNEVPDGEIGELIVKGIYTITSYYKNNSANEKAFLNNEFYRSGDKALIDSDGNIKIVGRVREMINRAGEKVIPSEIEDNLCKIPNVTFAAVVAAPSETLGQMAFGFVVTRDGEEICKEEVHSFFDQLGVCAFKRPDKIKCIDKIPLTKIGKVNKLCLEKMAEEILKEEIV